MNPTCATTSARAFWCIATGQGLSFVGMTTTLTALTVYFQHLPNGSVWVTALIVAFFLPATLLSAPASAAFTRWSANQVLVTSLVLRISLTLVAGALVAEPVALLACFVLIKIASVPESPAVLALAASRAPAQWADRSAFARLSLLSSSGAVAGPVVAGVGVGAVGVGGVLIVDAILTMLALILFVLTGQRASATEVTTAARRSKDKTASLRYLLLRSAAAPYVLLLALAIVFTAALPVAQSAFFLDERGTTPAQFSAVIAAFAAGRLIASASGSIITWPRSSQTALIGATIVLGLSLLLTTGSTQLGIAVALFAVAGYCNTLQTLSIRSIVNQSVPTSSLPQAFTGLMAVNNGATIIGTIVGGALVAATSGQLALQVAGGATAAIGVCAWANRFRRGAEA